jgi:hypothetical protein
MSQAPIGFYCLLEEVSMATPLDPKQIVSFEELLMSQVVPKKDLSD